MNEAALKAAEKTYSSLMDDYWQTGATPFAISEQINQKHQEIREKIKNDLKTNLKGPSNAIAVPFLIKLEEVRSILLLHFSIYFLMNLYSN